MTLVDVETARITRRIRQALAIGGCALLLGIVLPARPAPADTLTRKDGTVLTGTVRRARGGYEVVGEDGSKKFVPSEEVVGLSVGEGSDEQPGRLDVRLQSLRNSVANLSELDRIIEKYEGFIEQNEDSAAAEEARRELETWRARRESGYVKFAGEWIPAEERDERLREAFLRVSDIRLQIKRGDLRAAEGALLEVLTEQPTNVSALYLLGVLELGRDELGRAKSHLEGVAEQVGDHAPTMLNLGIINLRQNRTTRGLMYLEEAMLAAPGTREILDNVAEALAALPADEAESRQADRTRQLFLAQDAALRQEMARRGLYRLGSRWVTREEYQQFEAQLAAVEEQLEALDVEFRRLGDEIRMIDQKVESNREFLQRLQAERTYIDKEGRMIQLPLPPVYFEVEREQQALAVEREQAIQRQRQVSAAAEQAKAELPEAEYTGRLTPIGEDGVPVRMPEEPTTNPTTAPTTQPGMEPGESHPGDTSDVPTTGPTTDAVLPDAEG